MARGEYESVNK